MTGAREVRFSDFQIVKKTHGRVYTGLKLLVGTGVVVALGGMYGGAAPEAMLLVPGGIGLVVTSLVVGHIRNRYDTIAERVRTQGISVVARDTRTLPYLRVYAEEQQKTQEFNDAVVRNSFWQNYDARR